MLKDSQVDLCGRTDFTRTAPLLARDEAFSFACAGCGGCCRGREDNVPQPLGACFRCESKAALLYILYLAHNIQGKSIDTQGWQRDIDSIAMKFFDQEVYQFLQLRIITGA